MDILLLVKRKVKMAEYIHIKLKSTQHLRSKWNLAITQSPSPAKVVRLSVCNKLIAYQLLVCHRLIKAFPNAEAGFSVLAFLSPCMPYRPLNPQEHGRTDC